MCTAKKLKMNFSRAVRAWPCVVESLVRTQSIPLQKTQHAPYGLSLATARTYKKAQVPPDVSLAEHASCFEYDELSGTTYISCGSDFCQCGHLQIEFGIFCSI